MISNFLGTESIPNETQGWKIESAWIQNGQSSFFEASHPDLAEKCREEEISSGPNQSLNENKGIILPEIIHGVHEIYQDQKLIFQSGDPTFKRASSFYGERMVPCRLIDSEKPIV